MFADPVKNLRALMLMGLREDSVVADLGAGTGFYTLEAARLVPAGKVYAVEVQKDFVATITKKAKDKRLSNIECFWGNVEKLGGTKIKDAVVDAVIASNILFQVEDRQKFIEEIKRILKSGGKVLLVDWSENSALHPGEEIISKERAKEMFGQAGFSAESEINAGAHHYGMILKKL